MISIRCKPSTFLIGRITNLNVEISNADEKENVYNLRASFVLPHWLHLLEGETQVQVQRIPPGGSATVVWRVRSTRSGHDLSGTIGARRLLYETSSGIHSEPTEIPVSLLTRGEEDEAQLDVDLRVPASIMVREQFEAVLEIVCSGSDAVDSISVQLLGRIQAEESFTIPLDRGVNTHHLSVLASEPGSIPITVYAAAMTRSGARIVATTTKTVEVRERDVVTSNQTFNFPGTVINSAIGTNPTLINEEQVDNRFSVGLPSPEELRVTLRKLLAAPAFPWDDPRLEEARHGIEVFVEGTSADVSRIRPALRSVLHVAEAITLGVLGNAAYAQLLAITSG